MSAHLRASDPGFSARFGRLAAGLATGGRASIERAPTRPGLRAWTRSWAGRWAPGIAVIVLIGAILWPASGGTEDPGADCPQHPDASQARTSGGDIELDIGCSNSAS